MTGACLALFALFLPAVAVTSPTPTVEYSLVERIRSSGPSGGATVRAVGGKVVVSGGRARWTLEGGTFPRSAATAALLDGRGGLVLLDVPSRLLSTIPATDLPTLFRPEPSSETGSTSSSYRDLEVRADRAGAGRPAGGEPTVRWVLHGRWIMATLVPGRVLSILATVEATIDAAEGLEGARTQFDDLVRLFPARGEAAEAIARELEAIRGLPVRVSATTTSETLGETAGGGAPGGLPSRATIESLREVKDLVRRRPVPADAALLAVPEDFRSIPPERLSKGAGGLR